MSSRNVKSENVSGKKRSSKTEAGAPKKARISNQSSTKDEIIKEDTLRIGNPFADARSMSISQSPSQNQLAPYLETSRNNPVILESGSKAFVRNDSVDVVAAAASASPSVVSRRASCSSSSSRSSVSSTRDTATPRLYQSPGKLISIKVVALLMT